MLFLLLAIVAIIVSVSLRYFCVYIVFGNGDFLWVSPRVISPKCPQNDRSDSSQIQCVLPPSGETRLEISQTATIGPALQLGCGRFFALLVIFSSLQASLLTTQSRRILTKFGQHASPFRAPSFRRHFFWHSFGQFCLLCCQESREFRRA